MKLLNPDKVEKATSSEQKRLQTRVDELRSEEIQSVADFNNKKVEIEAEKKQLAQDTDKFIAEQKERGIESKREADAINTFRKDSLSTLLQPVHQLREEAETALRSVAEREAVCERKEKDVEADREKNLEIAEKNQGCAIELDEREKAIEPKEQKIQAEELRFKESAEELAKNWSEYHVTVTDKEFQLSERERILNDREVAIESHAGYLNQRRNELDKDTIALKSRYQALESAISEFEEKKKQHGTST